MTASADLVTQALCAADPALAQLIRRIGPLRLTTFANHSPFQALMHAVVAQQVSKQAAMSVRERLYATLREEGIPTAAEVAQASEVQLASAGISRRKAATLITLASAAVHGRLLDRNTLRAMDDTAIRKRLTAFNGIGPWTVDMLLIFYLARPDIFPASDLAVRRGFKIAFSLDRMPEPRALRARAELWRPYRSAAAWYLWRANELPGRRTSIHSNGGATADTGW